MPVKSRGRGGPCFLHAGAYSPLPLIMHTYMCIITSHQYAYNPLSIYHTYMCVHTNKPFISSYTHTRACFHIPTNAQRGAMVSILDVEDVGVWDLRGDALAFLKEASKVRFWISLVVC